jgi:hypothetical protein
VVSRANPDSKGSQDSKDSQADHRDSRGNTVSNGTRDSSDAKVRIRMRQ